MQLVRSQQNIMPEKTVADFFAGIGLVELGLEKLVGQLFTPLTTAMKNAKLYEGHFWSRELPSARY